MRYSTNTDLQAAHESFDTTADIIAADILREQRRSLTLRIPKVTREVVVHTLPIGTRDRRSTPSTVQDTDPGGTGDRARTTRTTIRSHEVMDEPVRSLDRRVGLVVAPRVHVGEVVLRLGRPDVHLIGGAIPRVIGEPGGV